MKNILLTILILLNTNLFSQSLDQIKFLDYLVFSSSKGIQYYQKLNNHNNLSISLARGVELLSSENLVLDELAIPGANTNSPAFLDDPVFLNDSVFTIAHHKKKTITTLLVQIENDSFKILKQEVLKTKNGHSQDILLTAEGKYIITYKNSSIDIISVGSETNEKILQTTTSRNLYRSKDYSLTNNTLKLATNEFVFEYNFKNTLGKKVIINPITKWDKIIIDKQNYYLISKKDSIRQSIYKYSLAHNRHEFVTVVSHPVDHIINDNIYFDIAENVKIKKTKRLIIYSLIASDINYYCIPLGEYRKRALKNESIILKDVKINLDKNE